MEHAFSALRTYARSNNRRLVDVAREVIEGTLPSPAYVPGRDEVR
jgi:hypothetical protein